MREEKRLLNVWQFYLRVLGSDVQQACHLADAIDDDVQWGATISKLGFAYSDQKAAANLRKLLRDCDAQAVAELADRLF